MKTNIKDDAKPRDLVANQVCRRLRRAQTLARTQSEDGNNNDTEKKKNVNEWVEGLSLVLSGVRAATSRLATSAPMAHNIVYQLGD